jgi:hypothetical protein
VAVDASDNVVVTGGFQGSADFGTGTLLNASGGSSGGYDVFVAKFDSLGACLWAKQFGSFAGDVGYTWSDSGNGVAVDSTGNILVTGQFRGTANFGGLLITNYSGVDAFVAKLSPNGVVLWVKNFPCSGDDMGHAIAVDNNGDAIVTGGYVGSIDLGQGFRMSAGDRDVFVVKLSGVNGASLWSKTFGNSGVDRGTGIAVDRNNNVVVTGTFSYTVDMGGGLLSSAGVGDIFVVKYSATGSHVWSKRCGGSIGDSGYGVATDSQNNVVLTGNFGANADFAGTSLTGDYDVFVAKYSSLGTLVWAEGFGFGGTGAASGFAAAVDKLDQILITGMSQGDIFLLNLEP